MSQSERNKPAVKIELLPDQEAISYRVDMAYIANLERKIEKMWQKLGARMSADPKVKLKFLVHLAGEVTNLRIEYSSGDHDIDQNALKSVKWSAPFEKLLHFEDVKTIPKEVWFHATF